MSNDLIIKPEEIQQKIFTVRNLQVMLDSDLAVFYGVDTRVLNQAVKRNIERFPKEFYFQLNREEVELLRSQSETLNLKSQSVTSNLKSQFVISKPTHGGRRKLPYVFTEQGIAMLSAVLRSETAVMMSIQIMNAFVAMRRFLILNAQVFQRLDSLEIKQLHTEQNVYKIFEALEANQLQPRQGIFFDGQVFDAYKFVCDLIRTAKKSIVLVDNFIDDTVLDILTKRNRRVSATIFTKSISKQLKLDIEKHNKQYPPVEIKVFDSSHDRFLIIDDTAVYHIGASLKDVGKKWFAFSKMDIEAFSMLSRLKEKG